jgi:hypothetical protein
MNKENSLDLEPDPKHSLALYSVEYASPGDCPV